SLPKNADEKKSDIQKEVPATGEGMPSGPAQQIHPDAMTAEKLMQLIHQLIPQDMETAQGPDLQCVMRLRRMADTPEKKAQIVPTLTAAGFILRPHHLKDLGVKV